MNVRQQWILACCILVLIIGAGFGVGRWISWSAQQRFDLGNKPPSQVFTQIFRAPVPLGLVGLKIAGESHLSGVFWMRFRTNNVNSVLTPLKRNPVVPITGPTADPNALPSVQEVAQDRYAVVVGWANASHIHKPEYYEFSTNPSGTGWFGVLIVDRAKNLVYAHGELL